MNVVIRPDKQKNTGILSGTVNAGFFDLVREMPGRRRWRDRDLVFELSRANIEFLQEALPHATWEVDRGDAIKRLLQLEEDARQAKLRPLPPEASNSPYKTKPRDHQRRAFMLSRDRRAYGWFLEQGLGKTKVGLDNAAYLWSIGKIDTLLIDAPNGVHAQWIDEQLPIHLPDWVDHKAIVYRSNQTKRWLAQAEAVFSYGDGLRIFAVHHDAFATDKGVAFVERVLAGGRTLWIVDESSRKIKTPGARRTKETLRLRDRAPYRRIGDGTPVTKGYEDLYTQLKFLSDDVHGFTSFYSYRDRYCKTRPVPGAPTGVVEIYGYQREEELQRRMDAYTIRVRSADCLDLPERQYIKRYVEMTDEQARFYKEMKAEMIAELDSGAVVSAEQAVVKILRLQQVLCGHVKTDDGEVRSIATNRVDEALAAAEQSGDSVILWARFHHDIDLLKAAFKAWHPVTWDGRTSTEERAIAKNDFIQGRAGAFIANPGSAGIGTDGLQHASHTMIYYSNTFKAAERWQSEARLYRDGQKGTVNVIDLIVPNTIDGEILATLQARKDVAGKALDIRNWLA